MPKIKSVLIRSELLCVIKHMTIIFISTLKSVTENVILKLMWSGAPPPSKIKHCPIFMDSLTLQS